MIVFLKLKKKEQASHLILFVQKYSLNSLGAIIASFHMNLIILFFYLLKNRSHVFQAQVYVHQKKCECTVSYESLRKSRYLDIFRNKF